MDNEFALVLYRSLMMITRYLEKRYGFGHKDPPLQYSFELEREKKMQIPE